MTSYINPPSIEEQYSALVETYQKGYTRGRQIAPSLKGLEGLYRSHGYEKALLSLAAHYIYVEHNPRRGLELLQDYDGTVYKDDIQGMIDDATCLLDTNDSRMVQISSVLRIEEYLGITKKT
jgi:hypothetical protein